MIVRSTHYRSEAGLDLSFLHLGVSVAPHFAQDRTTPPADGPARPYSSPAQGHTHTHTHRTARLNIPTASRRAGGGGGLAPSVMGDMFALESSPRFRRCEGKLPNMGGLTPCRPCC